MIDKKAKPVFKNDEASIGCTSGSDIRLKGRLVGRIRPPNRFESDCSILLVVSKDPTEKNPADWRWIKLKTRFQSLPEAREFIKKHWQAIVELYPEMKTIEI